MTNICQHTNLIVLTTFTNAPTPLPVARPSEIDLVPGLSLRDGSNVWLWGKGRYWQ